MKELYCFQFASETSLDEAWDILTEQGIELAYGSEEQEKYLYGYLEEAQQEFVQSIESITAFYPTSLPTIDWEAQWALHGLNFYDGYVHVDLTQFGAKEGELILKPGPGFGDLSHPTTRLMLSLMSRYTQNCQVIDIGCGSGILTLAAILGGALFVYGIDIESQALIHSEDNARLNYIEKKCYFCLPEQFRYPKNQNDQSLILINMILSEQKEAWNSLPDLHERPAVCVTSGIREEEKDLYLKQVKEWGWKLIEEKRQEGWLSFAFQQNT